MFGYVVAAILVIFYFIFELGDYTVLIIAILMVIHQEIVNLRRQFNTKDIE